MIRLLLACLSSDINLYIFLPLSLFLCVAGVTLMEISEVHRKVHLELEENVSAEERRRKCFCARVHAS